MNLETTKRSFLAYWFQHSTFILVSLPLHLRMTSLFTHCYIGNRRRHSKDNDYLWRLTKVAYIWETAVNAIGVSDKTEQHIWHKGAELQLWSFKISARERQFWLHYISKQVFFFFLLMLSARQVDVNMRNVRTVL